MRFSFTSRIMLWVHPKPSGGKRELCKEELHIGSSFASVHATSPLLNRCILLQSTLSPSSPTLLFFFSSTLLTSLFFSKPQVVDEQGTILYFACSKLAFSKLEVCLLISALGAYRNQSVFTLSTPSLTYKYIYTPNHCLE